jgi:hypothetical protein
MRHNPVWVRDAVLTILKLPICRLATYEKLHQTWGGQKPLPRPQSSSEMSLLERLCPAYFAALRLEFGKDGPQFGNILA